MNYLNSTVVALITVMASSVAFAQKDPNTDVTLANVVVDGQSLDAVTLSRDGLVTRFAQDLTFINNATNPLNRLYFTATVTNTAGTGPDNGKFEMIVTDPPGNFNCTLSDPSTLSCTSNISLNPHTTQKVTLVGLAPPSGTKLTVTVAAGGYEGNSQTGQGCCAKIVRETTELIDSTTDGARSYTRNAITFVSNTGGQLFTGAKSVALGTDPFTTNVDAPAFTSAQYSIGSIQETPVPAGPNTNCKGGNRFKSCYQTKISLPKVFYYADPSTQTPPDPATICTNLKALTVHLTIDSSLIKGNPTPDLSRIQVTYTADEPGATPATVYDCSASSGLPCICGRKQFLQGMPDWTTANDKDIKITGKGFKNGLWEIY